MNWVPCASEFGKNPELSSGSSKMLTTLFFIALIIIFIYYYGFKFYDPRLPPGPFPLPLIGNLHVLQDDLHVSLTKLSKKYGDVIRLYIGGNLIIVLSGNAIREGLVRNPVNFAGRPFMSYYKIALRDDIPLVLVDYGEHWKIHRRLAHRVIKVFGTNRYEVIIQREITELFNRLDQAGNNPVFIKVEMALCIMNIICTKIFNSRYDVDDSEFLEMFRLQAELFRLSVVAGQSLIDLFPILRFILPVSGDVKQLQVTNDRWRSILERKIHEHQTTFDKENLRDYTDLMLNAKAEKENSSDVKYLDERHLVTSITTLFIAGSETAATTLVWSVLYLLHFPAIQRRLHAEVDEKVGLESPIDLNLRKSMPYLEAFICETMRFTSILPLSVPHKATVDTTLQGHLIPQEATVIVNIWALHHDPSMWEDPHCFCPERFLDDKGKFVFPDGDRFLPFGEGPRACMGEVLARCELFLFLANLLQRYQFENPPDTELPSLEPLPGGAVLQPRIEKVLVKKRYRE